MSIFTKTVYRIVLKWAMVSFWIGFVFGLATLSIILTILK
jgi:hypothetical protein